MAESNQHRMSVLEFATRSGIDVDTIRDQMRRRVFPLGFAVKGKKRSYTYHIPREPAEYYLRTGRIPE